MKIEPVTEDQHTYLMRAVARGHGELGLIVSRLPDADLSKGRGVLEGNTRCLWTMDGCRITITLPEGGGLIVSCSNEPDPECPKEGQ